MRRMIDEKLYALKQQEDWIEPTLINGWENIENEPTYYYKDELGTVWIQLSVKSGSSHMFNIPLGYRPKKDIYWVGNVGDVPTVGIVALSGNIRTLIGTGTTRALISYRSV